MTKKPSGHICLGLVAHVDSGKTTLAESILYTTGKIRKAGRVDHKNAFLDTYEMEKERGITIFSKQAEVTLGEKHITLLDTPGHVDFSAEMERTLQVLDYAVLVINGSDGVQGHVETLWYLLSRYEIPVFLFVNKMDMEGTDKDVLIKELKQHLSGDCEDFSAPEKGDFFERMALHDEALLEKYLEEGHIETAEIQKLIGERKVFPCFFGSALKMTGIEEFLQGLERYMDCPAYGEEFAARVYKIGRDNAGMRLTYLKVTGGSLKVKMQISKSGRAGEQNTEKIDQIRIYSGASYETATEAEAGSICAVTGLADTRSGEGLGAEGEAFLPVLEPVLSYHIQPDTDYDIPVLYRKLKQMEEEIPELHIVWKEESGEIHGQIMGEVQIDVLREMIRERFGVPVSFGEGSIVYKETIQEPVEGVGHFEPLRHYAEVHLLLEPGEPGSGLVLAADCSEDMLDKNWQRLVLTHLEEKAHKGVLTGADITDVKITLIAGRAHQKHTEGGDFRQATYRAVRQGLRRAKSVLLEPVYEYRVEVPREWIGRVMSDMQRMNGQFEAPVTEGETAVLTGSAPVICMRGYQKELLAFTKGRGRFSCVLKGYEPCHNQEEVIEEKGYDPEADLENPTGSVFCAHGAGFTVSWDKVEEYMHLEGLRLEKKEEEESDLSRPLSEVALRKRDVRSAMADEEELQAIFARTYGAVKQKRGSWKRTVQAKPAGLSKPGKKRKGKEYLLVDGYNIIFAWEDLKALALENIEAARDKLMDVLCNYQGYRNMTLILVFDAYKVPGNRGETLKYHNIYVVYTKEAETADQYIEKAVHEMSRDHQVTVATSDALEQLIILGQGARRVSARGLLEEIKQAEREIRTEHLEAETVQKHYVMEDMLKSLRAESDKKR